MSHLRSAHDIFRYACLECCRDWTRIDPLMMPFECTIGGCEFAVSLCKVLLQRTALSKRLLREWDNLDLPITLNTWLFEECKLLAQTCNLRRADGTATYLSQLAHHILMTFSTEAATSMLLCSAAEHMKTLTDQSDPVPHAKAHMLLRCAEAFLRSVDLQNMCSRHKKSYENLRSYADSLRDSCRSFVSANLSCSDLIGRYLDKSDEEPNLAWTFVTHKEARYYKQPSKRKEWYQCNADYAKSILINL